MKRIVIAGGSGYLGTALARYFKKTGHAVTILSRSTRPAHDGIAHVAWDGRSPGDWTKAIQHADAVINLAGVSVDCRYTAANRRRILDSRIEPTRVIGEAIAACKNPPRVWLNASTATIYRHTFGPAWTESGEIGATPQARDAFSVEVALAWEKALEIAATPHTRKVALRTAMVLGHGRNSVFPVMRRLVRCGLGGPMAGGDQFVSWIHELDFCRAVEWILKRDQFAGPVNVAAPTTVLNREFMKLMRGACGVRVGLPSSRMLLELGAFFLRTETELIIKSRRVMPALLLKSGFRFSHPTLQGAIRDLMSVS